MTGPRNPSNLLITSAVQRRRAVRALLNLRGAAAAVRALPVEVYGARILRDQAARALEREALDVERALDASKALAETPVRPPKWFHGRPLDPETAVDP